MMLDGGGLEQARKIEQRAVDSSLEKITPGGEVSEFDCFIPNHYHLCYLQKVKLTTRCADIDREVNIASRL